MSGSARRPPSDGSTLKAGARVTALTIALACATGCATIANYDDPSGPIVMGPLTPAARPPADDLRIVTFNLKFGEHTDRASDLLSPPGPLSGADLLVLQEMDASATEALARALGLNYVYVPATRHRSTHRDFGVAILSPWVLEDPRKILLPHLHRFRKMRRAAVVATVRTQAGTVRVYGVHFESRFGAWSGVRRDQARTIATDAADTADLVVIAGDFNGSAGARELTDAGFTWLTKDVHNTLGPFDLDHILVRGLCPAAPQSAAKARDLTNASDHAPVWAVVRPCAAAATYLRDRAPRANR